MRWSAMEMDWLTRKMFLIPPPARIIQDFEEKWRDIREIHGERRAKFSIRAKKISQCIQGSVWVDMLTKQISDLKSPTLQNKTTAPSFVYMWDSSQEHHLYRFSLFTMYKWNKSQNQAFLHSGVWILAPGELERYLFSNLWFFIKQYWLGCEEHQGSKVITQCAPLVLTYSITPWFVHNLIKSVNISVLCGALLDLLHSRTYMFYVLLKLVDHCLIFLNVGL